MLLNIFRWLPPDVMLLKMAKVCKKFYILTWNQELLNNLCFYSFGTQNYNEIRFQCAKRIDQLRRGEGKDESKPRWIIEESQSEESSDFYSSDDNEAAHMRHDGNSSAEEENHLKDYLRRNAREERKLEQKAKAELNQREKDMKQIEEMKFNHEPIPKELQQKYQDEISEFQDYNF